MTFGQRLKRLRNEKNLTQLQLAEMINLSKANISKYESGTVEPNLQTLKLIANIFNVSMDFLVGKEELEETRTSERQALTQEQQKIASASLGLSEKEIEKIIDYVEFVKTRRNQ